MLLPALILALSGSSLATNVHTLSSNDDTAEPVESAPAWATPPSEFERRFSLELRLGVATPIGAIGIASEFAFVPQLGLGCGVGSNGYGPEYACWLRARPLFGKTRALTLSTGLSSAPFRQNDASAGGAFGWATGAMSSMGHSTSPPERTWEHAYWLNTDVGFESRRNYFLFRAFGGLAALLNPNDGVIEEGSLSGASPADKPLSVLIYAGLGVGFY